MIRLQSTRLMMTGRSFATSCLASYLGGCLTAPSTSDQRWRVATRGVWQNGDGVKRLRAVMLSMTLMTCVRTCVALCKVGGVTPTLGWRLARGRHRAPPVE